MILLLYLEAIKISIEIIPALNIRTDTQRYLYIIHISGGKINVVFDVHGCSVFT